MLDNNVNPPAVMRDIEEATQAVGFRLASDMPTGLLLRTLAASKPGGSLLEIGTGTGVGTAWLLDGMDSTARLTTVDRDEKTTAIARRFLGADPRVTFLLTDAQDFIIAQPEGTFDLIFADTYPGKFYLLDETLRLLKPGGFYVVDDLLPQPKWAEGHQAQVEALIATLKQRTDLHLTLLNWAVGIIVAAKR